VTVPELDGVRLKILRASEHLWNLKQQLAEFTVSDAYTTGTNLQPNPLGYRLIPIMKKQPDPALGPILGDVLHNLRSALDLLAWALVEKDGGVPQTDGPNTQFPIWDEAIAHVKKATLKAHEVPVRRVTIKGGVLPETEAVLESVQPYNRSEDPTLHPLSVLAHLSNIDKHRFLHPVAGRFTDMSARIRRKSDWSVLSEESAVGVFEHGAVAAVIPVDPGWDPNDMQMEAQFSPLVTLNVPGALGERELGDLLTEVYEFVRNDVADRFARVRFKGTLDLDPVGGFP
jgi:hypothetical protein